MEIRERSGLFLILLAWQVGTGSDMTAIPFQQFLASERLQCLIATGDSPA
jgi:hypothetical protein